MNARHTWFWLVLASGLFAFIFFYQRHVHNQPNHPKSFLPSLKMAQVTNVTIRPKGQLEIQAERTNGNWILTSPLAYPAQTASIENLLRVLERLIPATFISGAELKGRPNSDASFGFQDPYASILIQQQGFRAHIMVGALTAPGDQVFVQLIGVDGAYVVDAEFLKLLPRTANDWRDTALLDLRKVDFNRLTITNNGRIFDLEFQPTNQTWRMTSPIQVRADQERIQDCLEKLQSIKIQQFVTDDPKADLEVFGLQPADFGLFFYDGTNLASHLQFGLPTTNNPQNVYARRTDRPGVVSVTKDLLSGWRGPVNDFRDPHLLSFSGAIDAVEVHGLDNFTLLNTNHAWVVLPQNFLADTNLVVQVLEVLNGVRIVQFVKDVVTEQDLPGFGFSTPSLQFRLYAPPVPPGSGTNRLVTEITFGTNNQDRVYVRRSDEPSVYAVPSESLVRLPIASFQMRDRRIWNFSETNVARLTIRQNGKVRQLLRRGNHDWSLAPGSQGIINDLAVEETVKGLGSLHSVEWMAVGASFRRQFGFKDQGLTLELEATGGEKAVVEFGGIAESTFPFAGVTLDGEFWIFKFPLLLHRDIQSYLAIPGNGP